MDENKFDLTLSLDTAEEFDGFFIVDGTISVLSFDMTGASRTGALILISLLLELSFRLKRRTGFFRIRLNNRNSMVKK